MIKYLPFIICIILLHTNAVAQEDHDINGAGHDHELIHDHHKYHLEAGLAATRISGETGMHPGVHLHLVRQLGNERRWGIGLGYEAILTEELHNGINLLFIAKPFERLSVTAAPGLAIARHDENLEIIPAAHFEVGYELNLGGFHIGPMAGYGFDGNDSHFSVGIHLGIGF